MTTPLRTMGKMGLLGILHIVTLKAEVSSLTGMGPTLAPAQLTISACVEKEKLAS